MQIFLTGASGYVGRHVAQELKIRGHQVTGLARKPSVRTAAAKSIKWCFSDLGQLELIGDAMDRSDCVIHCAMDYSGAGKENSELDSKFVQYVISRRIFFIYTGNLYSPRSSSDDVLMEEIEETGTDWRLRAEKDVIESKTAAAVIRLGFVYGGMGGYLWDMLPPNVVAGLDVQSIGAAVWPMVHVRDVASLYATIAEEQATGVFHAYDGSAITAREIVEKLVDIYPSSGESRGAAHEHIRELLQKSVRTTNSRSLATGWTPAFPDFGEHAAQAYKDYLSVQ